jgi:uncharacterized membrane protein SpoIIM required for sporulation
MIIDLTRFLAAERPAWTELERMLDRIDADPYRQMSIEEVKRLHLLYQKVSADLGRISTFASEPELRRYLEALTARAYAEIHETRERGLRFRPLFWFANEFPRVFRRHFGAFLIAVAITAVSMIFGALATALDEDAKEAIMPGQFGHLLSDPAKRVQEEEKAAKDRHGGQHASFASMLMANNISVSIRALAFGMTWGLGTIVLLFYNGVILGLVAIDYILAGQTVFLLGWLMPHGVIEIPAILIAGQGGLALGRALIGWGDRTPFSRRLRGIGGDLMTLIAGVAVMLVWAGIVESFLSQYHEPVIRYWQKIAFGSLELAGLIWFLGFKRIADEEEKS